jgi:serine/threonine protein kinase
VKLIDFSISKVEIDSGVNILNDMFLNGNFDFDSDRLTKNITTRPYRAPEVALMS